MGAVTLQPNFELLPNTVIDQYPKAGSMAAFGHQIDVFVSTKGEVPTEAEN
jgi:beta-lactam-binding protein with PASTA domain